MRGVRRDPHGKGAVMTLLILWLVLSVPVALLAGAAIAEYSAD